MVTIPDKPMLFRSSVVRLSVARSTVVALHKVMTPAPQLVPTKQLINETLEVSLVRSDSRCCRYMSDLSRVKLRYFGVAQKGSRLLFWQPVFHVLPPCY